MSIGKGAGPQNFEHPGHILGKRRLERHPMSAHRVHKPQRSCMKGLPGKKFEEFLHFRFLFRGDRTPGHLPAAVAGITEHGMVNVRKVNPDLMGPSGAQFQANKGKVTKLLQHAIFRHCGFPISHNCHFFPVGFASSKIRFDDSRPLLEKAPDNGLVLPLDRAP